MTDGTDANDAQIHDGLPDGNTCWSRWLDGSLTFDPPQPLGSLNSSSGAFKEDVSVSPDQLTIWYQSNYQVWTASRASTTDNFGTPSMFAPADLAGSPVDSKLTMTDDGSTFVVASTRSGGKGNSDLWIATHANSTTPFVSGSTTRSVPGDGRQQLMSSKRAAVTLDFEDPLAPPMRSRTTSHRAPGCSGTTKIRCSPPTSTSSRTRPSGPITWARWRPAIRPWPRPTSGTRCATRSARRSTSRASIPRAARPIHGSPTMAVDLLRDRFQCPVSLYEATVRQRGSHFA